MTHAEFLNAIALWAIDRGVEPDDALDTAAQVRTALRSMGRASENADVMHLMQSMCFQSRSAA